MYIVKNGDVLCFIRRSLKKMKMKDFITVSIVFRLEKTIRLSLEIFLYYLFPPISLFVPCFTQTLWLYDGQPVKVFNRLNNWQ